MNRDMIGTLVRKDLLLFFKNRYFAVITIMGLIAYTIIYYIMPRAVDQTLEIGLVQGGLPQAAITAFADGNKTDKDGRYRFSTVLPGQYYGVKHIHIGAVRDGYEYLETQIIFKGDPNLDPVSQEKYAIHLEESLVDDRKVLHGRFDMVLRPIGSD